MRKLLIISTTFYPDPMVGAVRMTRFCGWLPDHGWEPVVLCRHYGYTAPPEMLARDVSPLVRVHYLKPRPAVASRLMTSVVKTLVHYLNPRPAVPCATSRWDSIVRRFRKAALRMVGTLIVPDVSVHFWRSVREQVLEFVQQERPDAILTTSPPLSNHDVGMWLTQKTGIPWVADFRDPYMIDDRFKPSGLGLLRWTAHRNFEEAIYRNAALTLHQIPIHRRWSRRVYPFARERMRTLTNGFPVEMAEGKIEACPPAHGRKGVRVIGTIPEPQQLMLARAVARLVAEGLDLELALVGKIPECLPALRELLQDRIVTIGYVSHSDAIGQMVGADVLVNFLDEFRAGTRLLSIKLIEYLALDKPIIAINPSHSDRLWLRQTSGAIVLWRPDQAALAAAIRAALQHPWRRAAGELAAYRRTHNWPAKVAQLAGWLEQMVQSREEVSHISRRRRTEPGQQQRQPVVSIVITTKNRKEDLRRAINSALAQDASCEVMVVDDASSDGTQEMVAREFPAVQLVCSERSWDCIVQRNRAAALARGTYIFSIDDDAEFSSSSVVSRTLSDFDHPRIGAVSIPHKDIKISSHFKTPVAPAPGRWVVASFVGTAYAVRRDLFLELGGYCELLEHNTEEREFCIRLLNRGFVVRLGTAELILHHVSPIRNSWRGRMLERRNDICFAVLDVPFPHLLYHLPGTISSGLIFGVRTGCLRPTLAGYWNAAALCLHVWPIRRPVQGIIYRLTQRLNRQMLLPFEEVEPILTVVDGKSSVSRQVNTFQEQHRQDTPR